MLFIYGFVCWQCVHAPFDRSRSMRWMGGFGHVVIYSSNVFLFSRTKKRRFNFSHIDNVNEIRHWTVLNQV